MVSDYDDSRVKVKKFIHTIVFLAFVFIFLYLLFWSKDSYDEMNYASNQSIRETKDCMGYTYDLRNVYYNKEKLSFDFYLLGFSSGTVDVITVISDKYQINNSLEYVKDFSFVPLLRPGETKPVSVDIEIDEKFDVIIQGCLSFPVTKILE